MHVYGFCISYLFKPNGQCLCQCQWAGYKGEYGKRLLGASGVCRAISIHSAWQRSPVTAVAPSRRFISWNAILMDISAAWPRTTYFVFVASLCGNCCFVIFTLFYKSLKTISMALLRVLLILVVRFCITFTLTINAERNTTKGKE